ncbi:MAG: plasmid pRiA4b ORF-3 family protein, partial [Anaerolineae bacterium]|nr:plasmid pRiA4b ORF-3 family protein [Anaerolineae bacterium]
MSKEKVVYQLKITLQGSKPPIWRRVLVASDTRLSIFHSIIQGAMGWYNCHLHQFIVGSIYYSMPYPGSDELNAKDSRKVKLSDIVSGERFTFRYEYDFGDGWMHAILVEKILPFVPGMNLPTCITGKRACPPEDVGGIWGY